MNLQRVGTGTECAAGSAGAAARAASRPGWRRPAQPGGPWQRQRCARRTHAGWRDLRTPSRSARKGHGLSMPAPFSTFSAERGAPHTGGSSQAGRSGAGGGPRAPPKVPQHAQRAPARAHQWGTGRLSRAGWCRARQTAPPGGRRCLRRGGAARERGRAEAAAQAPAAKWRQPGPTRSSPRAWEPTHPPTHPTVCLLTSVPS